MRGFISFSWGAFRLIGIPCLSHWALAAASPLHGLARQGPLLRQHRPSPALSGPSLRQAGDFTSMVNARLIGTTFLLGAAAVQGLG
jgi:hypothetical protein